MLSYKSLFALLVVIGMATALPIGGGGSGLPDFSGIFTDPQKVQETLSELQNSVPIVRNLRSSGLGSSVPTLPGLPGPVQNLNGSIF